MIISGNLIADIEIAMVTTQDGGMMRARPQGEYWDNSNGMIKMAIEVTKAYFTDHGPDLGDNAKLTL